MNKNQKKSAALVLIALAAVGGFFFWQGSYPASSSSSSLEEPPLIAQPYSGVSYAMNTVIEQKWYGPNGQEIYDNIKTAIDDIEAKVSSHVAESEIASINANAGIAPVEVSEDIFQLLQRTKELSLQSDGTFDLTIGPLVTEWDITGDYPHLPSQEEIDANLLLVDAAALVLDEEAHTVYLPTAGMAIDLGGIAKGWTTDQLRAIALASGATNGYVSLGGNLMVIGDKPGEGQFRFGVRDPRGTANEFLGIITLPDQTMATTGDYERYFEINGVRYHHVLDPRTGYPANAGLISVSVVSADGALADYLSTTLFVQGKETALAALNSDERFGLILVDNELNVYLSDSLKSSFTPHETERDYTYVDAEFSDPETQGGK